MTRRKINPQFWFFFFRTCRPAPYGLRVVFQLTQTSWHFKGWAVHGLDRDTDRCGERPHQHGPKGTDQYATVNGRLADAAAQGLQSINCRLKGARRTKNLAFAFLTYCHRWNPNSDTLISIIWDLEKKKDDWLQFGLLTSAFAHFKSDQIASPSPFTARTHTHIDTHLRRMEQKIWAGQWEMRGGIQWQGHQRRENGKQSAETQTTWKKRGKKKIPPPFFFFFSLTRFLLPLRAEVSPAPAAPTLLCCWCCGCPTGRRTHRQPRTAARVRDGDGRVWPREKGEQRRRRRRRTVQRRHTSAMRARYCNVSACFSEVIKETKELNGNAVTAPRGKKIRFSWRC